MLLLAADMLYYLRRCDLSGRFFVLLGASSAMVALKLLLYEALSY
jgi:hypothetical protein